MLLAWHSEELFIGIQINCFLANQLNTRKINLFNMNGASFENSRYFTTKKLANIKKNIARIFSLVNCSKFHQQNILLLYLSVNTDGNIPSICTNGITVKKKRIKTKTKCKMTCLLCRWNYRWYWYRRSNPSANSLVNCSLLPSIVHYVNYKGYY